MCKLIVFKLFILLERKRKSFQRKMYAENVSRLCIFFVSDIYMSM